MNLDIGPGYDRDNSFTRAKRLQQGQWRLHHGMPYGHDHTGNLRGSWIRDGAENGFNFLSAEAFDFARNRVKDSKKNGETWEAARLYHHMLSSQTLCVNLFYEIHRLAVSTNPNERAYACQLVNEALIASLSTVSLIEIEKAFSPSPIADKTGLDVLISGIDKEGEPVIYSIEVKYTEPIGKNTCSPAAKEFQARLAVAYKVTDSYPDFETKRVHWQLFRNLLLARHIAHTAGHQNVRQIVLAPAGNAGTKREIESLRNVLSADTFKTIHHITMEGAVDRLIGAALPVDQAYYSRFKERYL